MRFYEKDVDSQKIRIGFLRGKSKQLGQKTVLKSALLLQRKSKPKRGKKEKGEKQKQRTEGRRREVEEAVVAGGTCSVSHCL